MTRLWRPALALGLALLAGVGLMFTGPHPLSPSPAEQERGNPTRPVREVTEVSRQDAPGGGTPEATVTVGRGAPAATTTASPKDDDRAINRRGDEAAIGRGMVAFAAWCNSCHPGGGEGNGPTLWGGGATPSPARIRARVRASNPREVARFARLSDERLDDIIAYIMAQAEADRP